MSRERFLRSPVRPDRVRRIDDDGFSRVRQRGWHTDTRADIQLLLESYEHYRPSSGTQSV
jgi:hypothetical protein